MHEYYDAEAPRYDATRGGVERGRAAAEAICSLVPATGLCLDVAGGTGIVSAELAARGLDVVVVDRSVGMLEISASRLRGRAVAADATRLPVSDGRADLVTTIWLLHLVPELADQVMAEVARVLRPGGHWVTSVDKHRSHGRPARSDGDDAARVAREAQRLGLSPAGTAQFEGDTVWDRPDGALVQVFTLAAFRMDPQ